jgi:hypothetical protein
MSKKEDLKLVFDFIADFLKDEKPVEETVKVSKQDKDVEHMKNIMTRVDLLDKKKKTARIIPLADRDEDIAIRDKEIVKNHKKENEIDTSYLKERLSDAKTFIDELNKTHPIVDSTKKPGDDVYGHL